MKIESIRLKNFKSYQNIHLKNIPALCVVVGANGTGKTTLFSVFNFLKQSLNYGVKRTIQTMGGFKEVLSRGVDRNEAIEIEIKFKLKIGNKERLVTYYLELAEKNNQVVVAKEILRYKRGNYGSPFHFLDFSNGKGYSIINETDFDKEDEKLEREEQSVDTGTLAISGLGHFERFKAAKAFKTLLENWHISDFHINQARGSKDAIGIDDHLSVTGDNLQLVAKNLYENHQKIFGVILDRMKRSVPGVSEITPILTEENKLILKIRDGSFADPFNDKFVSDGTMKMFAYLVLLHDPMPYQLLCIEEPENQLYPSLLLELTEEFRDYARRGGQVFVSTHSHDLLDALEPKEVFWLVKDKGYTSVFNAGDDIQIKACVADGEKLGYLWRQGLFRGVHP